MALTFTPVRDIPAIVKAQRDYFASGKTLPVAARLENLRRMIKMVEEYRPAIEAAVQKDLGKAPNETYIMELSFVINEAWDCISHLREWAGPQHVARPGVHVLDTAYVQSDPKGTALIIGAFNYPVQLAWGPLVGALAAGCTAVVKYSELSANVAAVMTEATEKYFDRGLVCSVNGAVAESTALLDQKWDHICYTGSGRVGRIVMAAAAKHLTSVTLELGGKSPTYVDQTANVPVAARRIVWGSYVNAGQTCIRPDYVLVHPAVKAQLIAEMKNAIKAFWGDNVKESKDYGRLVSDVHFKRVAATLGNGKVAIGGKTDPATRFIEPTVLVDVDPASQVMQEETFGPVLPVLDCNSVDEAVAFINDPARDKPLAMYIFSTNKAAQNELLRRTSAGGVTINDTLMHAAQPNLPFGGCACGSGIGAYHGKRTFDMFSHEKAVLVKAAGMEFANDIRYPPYDNKKLGLLQMLMVSSGPKSNSTMYFAFGAVVTAAVAFYWKYYSKKSGAGLW
jgi:aldehyde dehydrogenase (NAD(P)+)